MVGIVSLTDLWRHSCCTWALDQWTGGASNTSMSPSLRAKPSSDGPARAIVGLRWLLKETGIEEIITKLSSALFTDSTVAEALASNLSVTDKTKHVAIKYHFVRELVLQGILLILRVHTSLNPADGGTKVLGRRIFVYIAELMLCHGTLVEDTRRVPQ
jgi:hypothetical protein